MVYHCKQNLKSLGISKNQTVCVIHPNSFSLIILYFALLLLNVTVATIDPKKGHRLIIENINQVKPVCIFSTENFLYDFAPIHNIKKIMDSCNDVSLNISSLATLFDDVDYDYVFLITFTSGSTGKPKGVMNSLNNFLSSSLAFKQKFNFSKKNIFYHNLPMSYIGGILNQLFLPLVSEGTLVLGKSFEVSQIFDFWTIPIKYSVNTFWFIPTMLGLLLKLDRGTNGIDYCKSNNVIGLVGMAPLRVQLKNDFQFKYLMNLYESYALSETFFLSTNYQNNDLADSVGKPLDGVDIIFSSDNEILVKPSWKIFGYIELDNKHYFINNFFKTGDVGYMDSKGFLHITDRKKDLIIRGGLNISPRTIENFLREKNFFEDAIVFGVEDSYIGEKTVCAYVNSMSSRKLLNEINTSIINTLGSDYKIDDFYLLEEIPRTSTGKINKIRAKELYLNFNSTN